MRNSEKNGSEPMFSSPNTCSRPNWRRRARCHSIAGSPGGAWVRDSLGSDGGLAGFCWRFMGSIDSQVGQAAFCQPDEGNRQVDIEMLGTLGRHRHPAALSEGMFDLNGNCDRSEMMLGHHHSHSIVNGRSQLRVKARCMPFEEWHD